MNPDLKLIADLAFRLLLKSKRARSEPLARAAAAAVDAILATQPAYHWDISPAGISWTPKSAESTKPA